MTEVNDKEFPVTVIGPYTFSIGNTAGFSDYASGGVALQVRPWFLIQLTFRRKLLVNCCDLIRLLVKWNVTYTG